MIRGGCTIPTRFSGLANRTSGSSVNRKSNFQSRSSSSNESQCQNHISESILEKRRLRHMHLAKIVVSIKKQFYYKMHVWKVATFHFWQTVGCYFYLFLAGFIWDCWDIYMRVANIDCRKKCHQLAENLQSYSENCNQQENLHSKYQGFENFLPHGLHVLKSF